MKTPFNTQRIVKPVVSDGTSLNVHSVFWTLQGEGPFSGHPAVFLRLADCNLQCPFCDTNYTGGMGITGIPWLLSLIEDTRPKDMRGVKLLVITGGEPFRQNLGPLIHGAISRDWKVQIETNGVLKPQHLETIYNFASRGALTIVVSPKTAKINELVATVATAFKYVLAADSINPEDGLPMQALGNKCSPFVARPPTGFRGKVYVNPMDAKDTLDNVKNINACVESSMKFGYVMGLQLHKYLGLE